VSLIEKAVVLSAGQGRRLLPLTVDRPKCLVELSGRSVLEWQLRALEAAGVREVVVVTGFAAAAVDAELARVRFARLEARTLFNPFYAVSDNLATCWLALKELADGSLLLNGDTLFETAVAKRLLGAPAAPITLAIDRKASYDSDDMKVLTQDDRVLAVGKTIDAYDAESIGFLRFSAEGAAAFAEGVEAALRGPEGLKRWFLSVINQLAQSKGIVRVQSIEGLSWGEMDFPEDVERNRELTRKWLGSRNDNIQ
jgi:choline kinase